MPKGIFPIGKRHFTPKCTQPEKLQCEGKFLTSFGTRGTGPEQFTDPYGIAVDKNGVVYVTDDRNDRLQSF